MAKIQVNIDDLLSKLEAMTEDEYSTVELDIDEDSFDAVLKLTGVGISEEDSRSYGTLEQSYTDF